MIGLLLIVSNLFSQNEKKDTILLKNIEIDGHKVFFKYESIQNLEANFGKLINEGKFSEYEIGMFLAKNVKNAFKYSNDQVSIAVIKKDAFLYYINFDYSKKKIYLKYNRKKIILSSSFKLSQFKAIFPNSYKNVSGLPVTPFERVAGVSLIIKDENKKSYLNFTFYDGTLPSIIITNNIITIRD